jgi:SpoVK/Ycf46/Vps4 family AAA+-type ATPase
VVVFHVVVDALCPRREGQNQYEARMVAQLLTLLDGAAENEATAAGGMGEAFEVTGGRHGSVMGEG